MGDNRDDESEKQPLLDRNVSTVKMRPKEGDVSITQAALVDPSSADPHKSSANGNGAASPVYTYEELSSGFSCPTCHGRGKIPRDRESEIVALIPYNDARLKPRRTNLHVGLSVLVCAIVAGVLCAFLIPRQIKMNIGSTETQSVWINTTLSVMKLVIQTEFSVSNENFVSAYGQNATVTAYWSELMKGVNTTSMPITIGGRTTQSVYANVTAIFTESFLTAYCAGSSPTHIIYMQFVATLQFKLMSQNQQLTETYYSGIKCQL